jgi:DNA polymerase-3 subunit alpha (Gram-positive type)
MISIRTTSQPVSMFYFDLETTGFNPYHNEITEIAVVKTSSLKTNFNTLVKTKHPISQDTIRLNGITNELVKTEGMSFNDAMNGFIHFIK